VALFDQPLRPRRAVILAAGRGSRLTPEGGPPKPLTPVNGRRIIDYTFDAVAAAGIRDVLVVIGYRDRDVRRALAAHTPPGLRLAFAPNPAWDGPASTSLRAARQWSGDDPFLLLMSDHVVSSELLERFLAQAPPALSCVAADASPRDAEYVAEATLLDFDRHGRVTGIGKGRRSWRALDTGAFILQPAAWHAVEAAPFRCELSAIFTRLAATHGLYAVDVSGTFWYDIDTPEDLATAAALLAAMEAEEQPAAG
jgi:1L-myo-inositol 1-phosphate cytidylyltransferase